ncbi:MAG: hypothetical protein L0Y72_23555 [Gemmataceae bacterium]|nr:hypothetical protein [Gemmataceae bacterium]MCI0742021.1 hypothetical protein [Gemmataceae bacterium]
MAWFRCFTRGENFPGKLAGETGLVGFYTTRFVEASSAEKAEALALEGLRAEAKLAPPAGYQPSGVGKREAQVVQYQLQNKEIGDLAEASVWIDTKTQLPLKRTMAGKRESFTETYSVFTLDSKLFEIPPN